MIQQQISLISFGYFRKDILEAIAEEVKHQFLLPVIFGEGHLDLSEFYDPARRQYNGNTILKHVDAEFASDTAKTLGLFSVDLFIPILTYIFGQAALNGRSGIASLYRLSNERYGIDADDKLLLERFTKEVIHELGHTFGLIHCIIPSCVMHASTYVEDIDQKEQHLCSGCRTEYENSLRR
jgi:archaemetzincin